MRQANANRKGAIFQVSESKWVAKICLGVGSLWLDIKQLK